MHMTTTPYRGLTDLLTRVCGDETDPNLQQVALQALGVPRDGTPFSIDRVFRYTTAVLSALPVRPDTAPELATLIRHSREMLDHAGVPLVQWGDLDQETAAADPAANLRGRVEPWGSNWIAQVGDSTLVTKPILDNNKTPARGTQVFSSRWLANRWARRTLRRQIDAARRAVKPPRVDPITYLTPKDVGR